jgi:hypothetical protein
MSTIHTGKGFILRLRRRIRDLATPLEGARVMLPIPLCINHYNHYMGAVDLSDQLRAVYYTQQPSVYNWYPYFYYFLDVAICNSYLL